MAVGQGRCVGARSVAQRDRNVTGRRQRSRRRRGGRPRAVRVADRHLQLAQQGAEEAGGRELQEDEEDPLLACPPPQSVPVPLFLQEPSATALVTTIQPALSPTLGCN